jgi:hypothetical protein
MLPALLTGAASFGGVPGDECASAIPVLVGSRVAFDTTTAGPSGIAVDASVCAGSFHTGIGADLWFRLDLVVEGRLTITTCDPDGYDTDLAILVGECDALDTFACNGDAGSDSACQPRHAAIDLENVTAGTYLIRVGGFNGEVGIGTLSIDFEPDCPADFDGDGAVRGSDLGLLFLAWGACDSCAADLSGDGRVDGADLGMFFLQWGDCS